MTGSELLELLLSLDEHDRELEIETISDSGRAGGCGSAEVAYIHTWPWVEGTRLRLRIE